MRGFANWRRPGNEDGWKLRFVVIANRSWQRKQAQAAVLGTMFGARLPMCQ